MQNSAEKIWSSAQEHLRSKLSADTYNMWFASLRASAIDNSHITLEAANEFCEVWLKDNYLSLLQDAVAIAAGRQLQIKFKSMAGSPPVAADACGLAPVKTKLPAPAQDRPAAQMAIRISIPRTRLIRSSSATTTILPMPPPRPSPRLPANPTTHLFLYGGVGLGKTHLLHAIGQHVAGNKKGARVAYLSSEKFTNEYIDGIQNNQLAKFRKKYRQTDVLSD